MRVGIGAVVGITGGPATYARELVAALARAGGHEYVVFTDRPEAFATIDVETALVPLRRLSQQVTWDHVRLPGLVRRHGVRLYHGTKAILPWRLAVPGVVTVHDLAVYALPETFAAVQRWHFRAFVPRSVRGAARVIADSKHARGDLLQRFGLHPQHVRVVPLGVRRELLVPPAAPAVRAFRERHGLGERLIACVGTIQPRKRIERVIEAFARARAADEGWQLVIAGRRRPGHVPAWLSAPPPGVRPLGAVDDTDLPLVYASAEVAISASDYEGFGLTVCEAMAAGCAVIAVAATSIPEVVGEAGRLVERSDAEALAAALRSLLADGALRRRLGDEARRRAAGFTWDETARLTRAVYEEVGDEVGK
jgi:glycosyltransferase involved in cell wall biosynthesis